MANEEKKDDDKAVFIDRRFSVPIDLIDFSAIRASGPGGQNVNKTSSAVNLQLDISAVGMPHVYRERIMAHRDRRISDSGVITIKAQNHRTQFRNRSEAIDRLKTLLREAVAVQEIRRKTKPSYGSVQRRLKSKTQRSAIKRNRGKVGPDD